MASSIKEKLTANGVSNEVISILEDQEVKFSFITIEIGRNFNVTAFIFYLLVI
jgi:hypothetical protein